MWSLHRNLYIRYRKLAFPQISTSVRSDERIKSFYSFMDQMLNLYKGQITMDDLKYNLSYKEALLMKEVREKRLLEEQKQHQFNLDNLDL